MKDRKPPPAKPAQASTDPVRIVAPVFMGVGLLFVILTAFFFWKAQKENAHSIHIKGHVTRLDMDSDGLAAPVVEYRLNGQKKFIIGNVRSSPPSHDVGDEIDLLVSNADSGEVTLNDPLDRYFMIGLFAFFGLIFGGIGVLLMVFLRD